MDRPIKRAGALAMVAALLVLVAAPVLAHGARVTGGSLEPFAAGTGHPNYGGIEGRAEMIRTASGKTLVRVTVRGLIPGETYGSHVHKQACADGDAGGHYSFGYQVSGGALDGSEIWPGPFTANAATPPGGLRSTPRPAATPCLWSSMPRAEPKSPALTFPESPLCAGLG